MLTVRDKESVIRPGWWKCITRQN